MGRGLALSLALIVPATFISGCESKAQSGAGLGALGGGLIGSLAGPSKNKEQNALIGAAVGGLLGYAIGNEMDKSDRLQVSRTLETGRSHEVSEWTNPDNGRHYAVTPMPAKRVNGRDCRDVMIDAIVDGRRETATHTACRSADGTWEM
ncbi:MAG: glycine zipper 2TM domain-containing protein [Magnetococcales bacterium]|nr:glycine zipper 2TM domain-containing protein [Magnetococcales bacterium]MBF0151417.1 glycine zipper 2TM domain-containing protein [Magnetococcales bacterium]MBF0173533.1 glycine zipper 2TM domain-containing protein [Magnetococcales bacterium]MBF0348984.1 glycine zipper 2TM domain-containing protein [Magnetococcales bacterium]MBF0632433.1 glycine zipper 2TM domain-containing protein [Magnetococcales bacterium]